MKASGMPAMWNSYINVDDLGAALAKTEEHGGTVTMPAMQVMDAGHMAGIQDPSGGYVFLWQAINHKGARLANDPGTWVWNELMTYEPETAMTFFSNLFGWEFEKDENSPGSYWMILNQGRKNGGLMLMTKEEFGEIPPCWTTYFNVSDMESTVSKLKDVGGQVYHGPFDSSVGPIAIVADNQGAAFNLIGLTVPPDE